MSRAYCVALVLALTSQAGHAQEKDELQKLKESLRVLQQRIEDLERRQQAPAAPVVAVAPTAKGDAAFNPAISLILQGTVGRSSRDPARYEISGFAPSGGEVGPARRGFSLGESELVMSGNIDPYFRGYLAAALTPEDELEVEEAYFQTLALHHGFTLKGGRFLSGIGYLNEIHSHAWDFADAPLAYKAFLAGRLNDDGVQLRWVAPTDLFVELGAEAGRGRTFPASDAGRNGAGAWSLFGHVGGDLGEAAWRAGLSHLRAAPRERSFEDVDSLGNPVLQSFGGRSRLWIADFVMKWPTFKLQGEYFARRESGELTYDDSGQAAPQFGAPFTAGYTSRQSGWYLQGVYQLMARWRAGLRYDRLDHGTVSNAIVERALGPSAGDFGVPGTEHSPTRVSAMVDWSPTEFSRLRLQLASDKSRSNATDRQILLQYIHSLGAHGAHRF
jgi:hypothetical protein